MTTRIKLRRDTAANWTTTNPVLALGEPGVETDTRRMKFGNGTTAWNSLLYSNDGDVTRSQNGFVTTFGTGVRPNNDQDDFWFDGVISDEDGNSYFIGGSEVNNGSGTVNHSPLVVKLNIAGEVEWQKEFNTLAGVDGFEGAASGVAIDPTNGQLVVTASVWNESFNYWEGAYLYRLNPDSGALITGSNKYIVIDNIPGTPDASVVPTDVVCDSTGETIFAGYSDSDRTLIAATPQTGSGLGVLKVLSNIIPTGIYPDSYNQWSVTGTGITGEAGVTAVNNYADASSTGGDGTLATFDFTFYVKRDGSVVKTVSINNAGTGYVVSNVLTVAAADAGASADATITVTAVDSGTGAITEFTNTYTPNQSYVKLSVDSSVDFSDEGTWELAYYSETNAFVFSTKGAGWARSVGNGSNDNFYSLALDSADNIYAGGTWYDDVTDHNYTMLAKFNSSGALSYVKSYDPVGFEGEDGFTGLAVDSQNNVIGASEMNTFEGASAGLMITKIASSTGAIVWQKVIGLDESHNFFNVGVALDSTDNIYVACEISGPITRNDDYFLCKLNSSGAIQWQRVISSPLEENTWYDNGMQILSVSNGSIYLSGSSEAMNPFEGNDLAVGFRLPTDGTLTGAIVPGVWNISESEFTISNTEDQRVFTPDVAVTAITPTVLSPSDTMLSTEWGSLTKKFYTGEGGDVGIVREIEFEDGSVQTTAATNLIPMVAESPYQGNWDFHLQLRHAGKFIYLNDQNGTANIYVPTNEDVPFEVGTVITLVINNFANSIYVRRDSSPTVVVASGYAYDADVTSWVINGGDNTGLVGVYTLMKVEEDRWILSGPDILVD